MQSTLRRLLPSVAPGDPASWLVGSCVVVAAVVALGCSGERFEASGGGPARGTPPPSVGGVTNNPESAVSTPHPELGPPTQEPPAATDPTVDPFDGTAILSQPANRCGDGLLDRDEACDEGPEGSLELGCTPECTLLTCGNGVEDPGEDCDDGDSNSDVTPNACRTNCLFARCGDGVTDGYEECDGDSTCTVDCFRIACGNGRLDESEECDSLEPECVDCRITRCGNRRVDPGEECEPPSTGMCGERCLVKECGNERIDEGEECDPPLEGECSQSCLAIECGNERIDEGEGCEPADSPGCNAECRPTGCGNGTLEEGEECDPPHVGTCDGQCLEIECDNGRIDEGEDCEPPNTAQCNAECRTIECNNGIVEAGEDCDPPAWGKCTDKCSEIRCGDGVLDEGEQCEPSLSGSSMCSTNCTTLVVGTSDEYLYTFDTDTQQWAFYAASPERLADGSSVSYDAQNGDVSPGTLKLVASFDGANQKIEAQVSLGTQRDFRSKVLKARVRLGKGLSSDSKNPGGIKLFVKTGDDWSYASGDWTYLLAGQSWQEVTLNFDAPVLTPNPDTYDASKVRQIGVELRTFSETTGVSSATVYLDSLRY